MLDPESVGSMKNLRPSFKALSMGLVLFPMLALAQTDQSSGSDDLGDPWESLSLNPKTRIKLGFRNANVDNVIAMIEQAANVTIVKDPTLTGPITVTTSKPVTLAQAFYVFDSGLRLRGFAISRQRSILVIKALPKPNQRGGPGGDGPFSRGPGGAGGQAQVKFYPLQFASAVQVARAINDVFQANQATILGRFPGGGPGGGGPGGRGPGGAGPGGASGDGQDGQGGGPSTTLGGAGQVKASYEEFSNSVIINAPAAQQAQVAALIKQIDKEQTVPQHSKTYSLQYANASDTATIIQNVLSANASKGRGTASTTPSTGQQGFGPFGRFGGFGGQNSTSSQTTSIAVPDTRTNQLIVTGTDDLLKLADKVVADLDKKMPFATTAFVFRLQNARADTIATLLTSTFGQRQGASTSRTTTGVATNNTFSSSSSTSTRSTGGAQGGANTGGDDSLAVKLQDPNAPSGDLLTSVGVTQGIPGFGGQGGGQGQRSSSSSTTTGQSIGYDATGKITGVHDLTGQVTAIADPSSNSVIVVTSPDNADLVRDLLNQLDIVPEQVMIQTVIVEATLDKSDQMGVEYKFAQSGALGGSGSTGTLGQTFGLANASPALTGFSYTLSGGALSAFFNMLQTDTKFQVLSTPRIFASNNMEAQINISQSIPYIVSTIENTNGTTSFNYAFQDVGIVLTVTPHITSNGYVTMDVTQTANDLQGYTSFNAPIVNQREAETTVSAKDGDTIVLGGMIRNQVTATVNKVPLLGDIPLLGNLFKSTSNDHQKTELLVFLTPKIVRDPAEAKKLKESSEKEVGSDVLNLLKDQGRVPAKPAKGGERGEGP